MNATVYEVPKQAGALTWINRFAGNHCRPSGRVLHDPGRESVLGKRDLGENCNFHSGAPLLNAAGRVAVNGRRGRVAPIVGGIT